MLKGATTKLPSVGKDETVMTEFRFRKARGRPKRKHKAVLYIVGYTNTVIVFAFRWQGLGITKFIKATVGPKQVM